MPARMEQDPARLATAKQVQTTQTQPTANQTAQGLPGTTTVKYSSNQSEPAQTQQAQPVSPIPEPQNKVTLQQLETARAASQAQGNQQQVSVFDTAIKQYQSFPKDSVVTGMALKEATIQELETARTASMAQGNKAQVSVFDENIQAVKGGQKLSYITAEAYSPEQVKMIKDYNAQVNTYNWQVAQQNADAKRSTDFWTSQGYPQYSGKYAPVVLPVGAKITKAEEVSMSGPLRNGETRSRQLIIAYSLPSEPQTSAKDWFNIPSLGLLGKVSTAMGVNRNISDPALGARREASQTAVAVGIVALPIIAAPEIAPAWVHLTVGSMALGAGLSVGITQAQKAMSGGGLLTRQEFVQSGLVGEAFTVGSSVAFGAIGKYGGEIGAKIAGANPAVAPTTLIGKAGVSVARVGISTGIGATGGYVISGGKPEGAIQGAELGFAFGLAGETFRTIGGKINQNYDVTGRVQRNFPVVKYGEVEVPLDDGTTASWKGLYISKGSEAKIVTGKVGNVPDGMTIDKGYVPQSNIESEVTQQVMKNVGYSPETLGAVSDVREIMVTTQNVKPKLLDDVFPERTRTLSESGTTVVKSLVKENLPDVEMVYGSYATKPQLSQEFEYSKGGVSALRTPGDIDIQLRTDQVGAEKFTSDLVTKLQGIGEKVHLSQERPTLIETDVGGHAVDIHYKGEPVTDVTTPVTSKAWGIKFSKPVTQIESIPVMSATEQGLRKGASILGFQEEQTIGPQVWRGKDIPDFFQVQRTLLEQMPQGKTAVANQAFDRAATYYGVTGESIGNVPPEDFLYVAPSPQKTVTSPLTYLASTSTNVKPSTVYVKNLDSGKILQSSLLSTSLSPSSYSKAQPNTMPRENYSPNSSVKTQRSYISPASYSLAKSSIASFGTNYGYSPSLYSPNYSQPSKPISPSPYISPTSPPSPYTPYSSPPSPPPYSSYSSSLYSPPSSSSQLFKPSPGFQYTTGIESFISPRKGKKDNLLRVYPDSIDRLLGGF